MSPISVVVISAVRILRDGVATLLRAESGLDVTVASPVEAVERVGASGADAIDDIGGRVAPGSGPRRGAGAARGPARAAKGSTVALVDLTVPDLAGTVARLAACSQVVVFGLEDDSAVIACAEAGAVAYVPIDASLAELREVLLAAAQGGAVGNGAPLLVFTLMRRLAALARVGGGSWWHDGQQGQSEALTLREREIAELLERGLGNKQIAARLGIEVPTVKNHVHNILTKLHVHRRGEAAARLRSWLSAGHAPAIASPESPGTALPGSPDSPARPPSRRGAPVGGIGGRASRGGQGPDRASPSRPRSARRTRR